MFRFVVVMSCFLLSFNAWSSTVNLVKKDGYYRVFITIKDHNHKQVGHDLAMAINQQIPDYPELMKKGVTFTIGVLKLGMPLLTDEKAYQLLSKRADTLFNNLQPEYQDELSGFISAIHQQYPQISGDDIKMVLFMPDIAVPFGCTYYSAWGNKSNNGTPIMGRNLDYADPFHIISNTLAVITIRDGDRVTAQVGSLLSPFANMTFFNKKLALSDLVANTAQPLIVNTESYPVSYAFREAAENANNLDTVRQLFNSHQFTWGSLTAVMSANQSAVLENAVENSAMSANQYAAPENAGHYLRIYRFYNSVLDPKIIPQFNPNYQQIAAVNTFMLPGNPVYFDHRLLANQLDNKNRWLEFYKKTNHAQKTDEHEIMQLMSYHEQPVADSIQDIYNKETLFSVVYTAGKDYAWMAFNSNQPLPQQMKYQKVNLWK